MTKISRRIKVKISRNQFLVLLGGTLISVFVVVFILNVVWGGVRQPIAFNHKIHAENDSGESTSDRGPFFFSAIFSSFKIL
jgi:hypothetical protein